MHIRNNSACFSLICHQRHTSALSLQRHRPPSIFRLSFRQAVMATLAAENSKSNADPPSSLLSAFHLEFSAAKVAMSACQKLSHKVGWWRGWTKNKSWRLYKHHAWFFQTCVDFGILLQSLFICLHFVDRCQNNKTGLYQLFRSVFLAAISNSRNKQWITFHSYRSFTLPHIFFLSKLKVNC